LAYALPQKGKAEAFHEGEASPLPALALGARGFLVACHFAEDFGFADIEDAVAGASEQNAIFHVFHNGVGAVGDFANEC